MDITPDMAKETYLSKDQLNYIASKAAQQVSDKLNTDRLLSHKEKDFVREAVNHVEIKHLPLLGELLGTLRSGISAISKTLVITLLVGTLAIIAYLGGTKIFSWIK